MRTTSSCLSLLILAIAAGACAPPDAYDAEAEVARIRAHFDSVVTELRAAWPRGLSQAQMEARWESIRWLEEYRAAGVFPHNHERPGRDVPIFVDPHGTPCAVAYLMARSGAGPVVEDVVRHANQALVPDLGGDAQLLAWLDRRGLTLAEAARIQVPGYIGQPLEPAPQPSSYAGETVGISIVTAAAAVLSERTRPSPDRFELAGWVNLAGVASHGVLLAAAATSHEVPRWQIGVNLAGAVLSGTVALRRFWRRGDAVLAMAQDHTVALSPYVGGDADGRVNVGLTLRH